VVDEDPILASEIASLVGLRLVEKRENESDGAFRRRVLDRLIDRLVQTHEVESLGLLEVPVDRIEAEVARLEDSLGSPEALDDRLADLDLSRSDLAKLLTRQLAILTYVDERLGPRVFVSLEEIRAFYNGELRSTLAAQGQSPPPIEEVREEIRKVLKERHLNRETERWTEELRLKADIQIYLDELPAELPAPVERLEAPSSSAPSSGGSGR
jgi:hypothetical protein